MLHSLVAVKQVADLENMIPGDWVVSPDGREISLAQVGKIMNPYDANALELALRMKERYPEQEMQITVLTMGGPAAEKLLTTAYAVGADRCLRLEWEQDTADQPGIAAALLTAAIQHLGGFDLLFFGVSAGVYDNGQTGIRVAERLNCPCVPDVIEIEPTETVLRIKHFTEQGIALSRVKCPVLVTVSTPPGLDLRCPTLKASLAAARKTVERLNAAPLDRSPETALVPEKTLIKLELPQNNKRCSYINRKEPHLLAQLITEILTEGGGDHAHSRGG